MANRKNVVMELDDTDRQLIALLRHDARMASSKLAVHLGVSRTTVQNRISKLQNQGVIRGFTVKLDEFSDPNLVRAIITVEIDGPAARRVIKRLQGFPEIVHVYGTNGRWDLVAEAATQDLNQFNTLLGEIRMIAGVANTESSLLLSEMK